MEIKDVISNVKIYDLEESLVASGYPMRTDKLTHEFDTQDIRRAQKLVEATKKGDNAHAQFMTGIRVNFDLTFSNKAWVEAERYRFLEFVSSQSTQHRITKFSLDEQYVEYVDKRIIDIMKEKVEAYNKASRLTARNAIEEQEKMAKLKGKYLEILYSNPAGFKITARMATNYRCLRNIYIQRKTHRLPEWRIFCDWIKTLPYAEELLVN